MLFEICQKLRDILALANLLHLISNSGGEVGSSQHFCEWGGMEATYSTSMPSKTNVKVVTPAAARVLQTFYLELRAQHHAGDCVPITTRQLESMIRLTEARAKLELREEATEQDALDVVEIMKACMVDTFSDHVGVLDFSRSQMGSGMSGRGAAKKFIQVLQRQADVQQKNLFTVDEMKTLATMAGINVPGAFSDFILTLNNQGFLIKKSPKLYQLLSADY